MSKIHLKVESLAVESFHTDEPETGRGTVHAHVTTPLEGCVSVNDQVTCARLRSDYNSCYVRCECTDRMVKCFNHQTG